MSVYGTLHYHQRIIQSTSGEAREVDVTSAYGYTGTLCASSLGRSEYTCRTRLVLAMGGAKLS